MKCMPSTRSGRFVAAPSTVIEIDEVLDERIDVGTRELIESREERELRLALLEDGLDDVVDVGRGRRGWCRRQPAEGLVAILGREPSLLDELAQALFDRRSRAVEGAGGGVDEPDIEPALREHLGDTVAHRACANHADASDVLAHGVIVVELKRRVSRQPHSRQSAVVSRQSQSAVTVESRQSYRQPYGRRWVRTADNDYRLLTGLLTADRTADCRLGLPTEIADSRTADCRLLPLNRQRDPVSSAEAERGDAAGAAGSLERVEERRQDARAAGADRRVRAPRRRRGRSPAPDRSPARASRRLPGPRRLR